MTIKMFGLEIKADFLFICFVVLITLLDKENLLLLSFFAILLHELGHIFVLWILGTPAQKITVSLYDIKIYDYKELTRPATKQLMILLAGPIFNLITFFISITLNCYLGLETKDFGVVNLILLFLNILPLPGFDGGEALTVLLDKRKYKNGIISFVSLFFLIFLLLFGLLVFIETSYNFSLILLSIYMCIIFLLKQNSMSKG